MESGWCKSKEECPGKRLRSDEDECDGARQDSEEMMHKMIRGKSSIEGNVFDPPPKGKIRKTDIIDKDNKYAGKQARSVDARVVTQRSRL